MYKCNYDFCLLAVTDLGLVISAPGQPWTTRLLEQTSCRHTDGRTYFFFFAQALRSTNTLYLWSLRLKLKLVKK